MGPANAPYLAIVLHSTEVVPLTRYIIKVHPIIQLPQT